MTETPRTLRVQRPRQSADRPIAELSALELKHELNRRIRKLQSDRTKLLEQLRYIEGQLREIGVDPDAVESQPDSADLQAAVARRGGPRGPRRNRVPLVEILHGAFKQGGGLTTREAADAALAAGYETTSNSFTNIVNVTLHRDVRFVKRDGKWYEVDRTETDETQLDDRAADDSDAADAEDES
ncbi:MAG: hypothetical protein ACYTF9_04985 [Planctomycetota bacterium]|jgi:hypothetical protein